MVILFYRDHGGFPSIGNGRIRIIPVIRRLGRGVSRASEFPDVLNVVFAALGDVLQCGLPASEHLALGAEEPLHCHGTVLGLHICHSHLPTWRFRGKNQSNPFHDMKNNFGMAQGSK